MPREAQNPWNNSARSSRANQLALTTHILVVNGGQDEFPWIDHCLWSIRKFSVEPYLIHLFDYNNKKFEKSNDLVVYRPNKAFNGFRNRWKGRTDYASYPHQSALSWIAKMPKSGWIITLDSDSIATKYGWNTYIAQKARSNAIVALSRRLGADVHPGAARIAHPSCLCTPVITYKFLNCDFYGWPRNGYVDTAPQGEYNDTAAKLTRKAKKNKVRVSLIHRSNDFDGLKSLKGSGPALFGLYDDFVYHHGCGSRNFNYRWPSWVRELSDKILGKLEYNFSEFVDFIAKGER